MSMATQQVADQVEIHGLLHRYSLSVDGKDWDMFRSIFTSDAVIDYTDAGGPRDGVDPILEFLDRALAPFACLQHNITTTVVDVTGDAATACSYYLAVQTIVTEPGIEMVIQNGGYYRDRLVRTPQGWRIRERTEHGTWIGDKYPEGVPYPTWYGTPGHRAPSLPR